MAQQASIPQLQRCQALQKLLSLQEDLASLTRRQHHQSNERGEITTINLPEKIWNLAIEYHEIT